MDSWPSPCKAVLPNGKRTRLAAPVGGDVRCRRRRAADRRPGSRHLLRSRRSQGSLDPDDLPHGFGDRTDCGCPHLRVDRDLGAAAHRDLAPAAGFSCGGELGGATAILVENAPEGRRGLYASWQTASQAAGLLLGAMMTTLVSLSMTPAQFEAGGWRWLFAIGLFIVPVGFYIRSKLDEPEAFLKARKEAAVFSFTETVRDQYRPLLTGTGVAVLYAASAYVLFIYMPTFAVRQLGLPFSQVLIAPT